jgi:uncharacterized protein with beta-barrel porin domain
MRNGWRPLWGAALVLAAVLAAISPAGAGDLIVDGSTHIVFGAETYGKVEVGPTSGGMVLQGTGTMVIDTSLTLGTLSTYQLYGTAATQLQVGQNETIGTLGASWFNQGTLGGFGGTHSVGWDLVIGKVGLGTFTLESGLLGAGALYVGQDETVGGGLGGGVFLQGTILGFSGNHTVNRDLIVGSLVGAGAFTLCGSGTLNVGQDEKVGGTLGGGAFFQGILNTGVILDFSGNHTVNRDLIIGNLGLGAFTLNGSGVLQVGRDEIVGSTGIGAFITSAGFSSTHTVGRDLIVGNNVALSTFALDGKASSRLEVGQDEYVGKLGLGTFTTSANFAGAHTITRDLILGHTVAVGIGEFTLDGTGTLEVGVGAVGGSEIVGKGGSGKFTTNATFAGSHTISHDLILGSDSTLGIKGTGEFTLNGTATSKLEVGRDEIVGKAGSGTFITSAGFGGTHTIARDLILGSDSGGDGTFTLDGTSPLPVGRDEYVGKAGTGTFITNAAFSSNHTVTRDLILGNDATGVGTFTLNGTAASTLSVGQDEYVGKAGTGTFTQTNGIHTVGGNLTVGATSAGPNTFTLNGGSLTVGTIATPANEYIGDAGTGTFTTNAGFAGTHTVTRDLILGSAATGVGTFTLGGTAASTLSVGRDEYVGKAGTGTFTQTNGIHTVGGNLTVGATSAGPNTFTLNGGSLTVGTKATPANEYIGDAGTGTFSTNAGFAGTHTVTRDLILGNAATGIGTFTLDGTGTLAVTGKEIVGNAGLGAFTQTNGTHTVGGNLTVGATSAAANTFTLNGGTLGVTGNEIVGDAGRGTFTQAAGTTHTVAGNLTLGHDAGSSGTYAKTGGTLDPVDLIVGDAGTGTFTQAAGTTEVTNQLILGNQAPAGHGTFNLNGGDLYAGVGFVPIPTEIIGNAGTGIFNQNGGTNTVTNLTLSAIAGSTGTYNLSGGTLTATTVNLNPGGTFNEAAAGNFLYATTFNQQGGTVGPGTLQNQGIPPLGTGTFNYYSGTFTGSLHNYSRGIVNITPNNLATGGTLNIGGSYTQDAGGLLNVKIFPASAPATDYDKITVGVTATLDGRVQPLLYPLGPSHYRPRGNQDYVIITAPLGANVTGLMTPWPTPALQDSSTLFWDPRHTLPNTFDLYVMRNYTNPGLGLNSNQASVGAMLNGLAVTAPLYSDLDNVLNAIDYLPSVAAVKDAYKQISPEKSAALADIAFAGAKNQMRNLAERITDLRFGTREILSAAGYPGSLNLGFNRASGLMLAYNSSSLSGLLTGTKEALPESRWGLFLEPNVIVGSRNTTVNRTGYDFTTAGFTVGADYRVRDNLLVGLATGYNHTDAGFNDSGGSVQNTSWPITAYAAYLPETFYIYGSLGYTLNLFNLERGITFAGLNRKAKSSPTGNQFNAYGEAGYDLKLKPFVVTPTVSLAYTSFWLEGFTEDGAGALNLKVSSQSADSLQTGVGAKVSVPIKRGDTKIVPQVYATYQHEFSNDTRGLDARLSQGSSTFIWVTDKPKRDFAVVGGNLTVGFSKNLAAQANYNVELGKDKDITHSVNVGMRYQF